VIEHPLWFENNQILLYLLTQDLKEKDRGSVLVTWRSNPAPFLTNRPHR